MRLDNIRLLTPNLPRCLRFYSEVLLLPILHGDEESRYVELGAGEASVALFDAEAMEGAMGPGSVQPAAGDSAVLVLHVDNLDATAAALRSRGVGASEPEERKAWGIRTVHLRDPDGRLVELYEELEPEAH